MTSRLALRRVYQAAVLLLMAGVLWYELRHKQALPDIWRVFQPQGRAANWGWLLMAVALMPFNWYCEVLKWQPFVARYTPLSKAKAFAAVLAGVSVSLFTPNRVGEFGGRLLFVPPDSRWIATLVNFTGNLSQFLVLLSAGGLGTVWFAQKFLVAGPFCGWAMAALALIGLLALYWLFFNIRVGASLARRVPLPQRLKPYLRSMGTLERFSTRDLWKMYQWSLVRYLTYSTQYYFLLNFFGIFPGIIGGYAGIFTIFLLQSSIPLPPLAGVLARGALAIHLWAYFGASEDGSLASSFALWIINLIFAALIGTFFLLRVNIGKALSYEDD